MCQTFQQWQNASNASKPGLESQLRGYLSNNNMGGYGFYFAPNPFVSSAYGMYLLVGYVPPKRTFPFYLGNNAARVVQTVLTNSDAVLYLWCVSWFLVARDYYAFTFADNTTKAWLIDFSPRPDVFFAHKVTYGTWTPVVYLQTFRDIFRINPPVIKPLKGGKDIADADLLKVIAWEWQIGCNTTALAVQKLADPSVSGQMVAMAFNGNQFGGQWPQLLKVLNLATYLPANSNVTSGDYKSLQAAVIKQYRARGGAKIVTQYYVGYDALKSQDPRIETWYRHPH